ncbi:MAG: YbeF family protein [Clostridia bacterium]|nr:YbeF family protein [Clostridia bacterium]
MDINTILLIFFAIPLGVIIFSIALQKLVRNPFLVASIIFAIFLIVVLAFFDSIFLILVIAYTILSFVTALITKIIWRFFKENGNEEANFNKCNVNKIVDGDQEIISVSTNENNELLNSKSAIGTNQNCGWNRRY